jgi:hypothetical protein
MFFWDWTLMLIIPAAILALYAQWKVKSTYKTYNQVQASKGLTGRQAAEILLRENGIEDVTIEEVAGELSDHYDPRDRTVHLSSPIYRGSSISSISVAAHEVGHAIQHNIGYYPLTLRHSILPVTSLGSWLAWPLFFAGFIFSAPSLMDIGIILFTMVVLFQVVTLPVEFNASTRALLQLQNGGYLRSDEYLGAKKVLQAAALTYVAASAMAILQLIRLLILRQSRD